MPDGTVVRMNRRMRLAKKSQERRLAKKGVVARSAVMVMACPAFFSISILAEGTLLG